ncbi:MAG: cobalamin-binding protein [Solirubrobacteraceae bacterium]
MRIVSLVPSATEICFALGLDEEVVGVTHECDWPHEVEDLPRVTRDVLTSGLGPAEIDAAVRECTLEGKSIYELDEEELHRLEPDLIITQAVCAVCAVAYEDVVALAQTMEHPPDVISLDPSTLGEVLGDVRTVAEATGRRDQGVELVQEAAERIDRVRLAVRDASRPRVAALEWLDPVYAAGHWTPQIVEYAGGEDVLGLPGEHSRVVSWEEVAATRPEVVVVMPCGYEEHRAAREAEAFAGRLATLSADRVVAVDAAAHFSRPGPRLIDGLEELAHVLHPVLVDEPEGGVRAIDLEERLAGR